MTELALVIPSLALAFLLWQAQRAHVAAEAAWRSERAELLTRIQAPEIAPSLSPAEVSDEPLYIPYGDDEAFEKYVEQRAAGQVT